MISHRYRCIFVHVPKTAGESIEDLIWPGPRTEADLWMGFVAPYHNKYQTGGLQHLLATQIRSEVGDRYFRSYFKFAFVRNPWERAVSQYASMNRRPDLREFLGMDAGDDFKTYLHLIQKREHVQWMPQHRFVLNQAGDLAVDFLGRFERLQQDLHFALARIGLRDAVLPHKNPSGRLPLTAYYDPETVELVGNVYADDALLFGYEPPPEISGR